MKKIYENFEEMADDMVNGEFLAHQLSGHSNEICFLWIHSIKEFARALDNAGVELPQEEEIYEKFWQNMSESLVEWRDGTSRRKPYSKKLGEMPISEAKARYDFSGSVGMKLIIPRYSFHEGQGEVSEDYYLIIE